jgi:hypothetical protein
MKAVGKVLPTTPLRGRAKVNKEETLPRTATVLAALLVTLQMEVVKIKVIRTKVAKAVTRAASQAHVLVPALVLVTTRVAPTTLALAVQVQARMVTDFHLLHASQSAHQTSSALAENAFRFRTPCPAGHPATLTGSSIARTMFVHQATPASTTAACG